MYESLRPRDNAVLPEGFAWILAGSTLDLRDGKLNMQNVATVLDYNPDSAEMPAPESRALANKFQSSGTGWTDIGETWREAIKRMTNVMEYGLTSEVFATAHLDRAEITGDRAVYPFTSERTKPDAFAWSQAPPEFVEWIERVTPFMSAAVALGLCLDKDKPPETASASYVLWRSRLIGAAELVSVSQRLANVATALYGLPRRVAWTAAAAVLARVYGTLQRLIPLQEQTNAVYATLMRVNDAGSPDFDVSSSAGIRSLLGYSRYDIQDIVNVPDPSTRALESLRGRVEGSSIPRWTQWRQLQQSRLFVNASVRPATGAMTLASNVVAQAASDVRRRRAQREPAPQSSRAEDVRRAKELAATREMQLLARLNVRPGRDDLQRYRERTGYAYVEMTDAEAQRYNYERQLANAAFRVRRLGGRLALVRFLQRCSEQPVRRPVDSGNDAAQTFYDPFRSRTYLIAGGGDVRL